MTDLNFTNLIKGGMTREDVMKAFDAAKVKLEEEEKAKAEAEKKAKEKDAAIATARKNLVEAAKIYVVASAKEPITDEQMKFIEEMLNQMLDNTSVSFNESNALSKLLGEETKSLLNLLDKEAYHIPYLSRFF